MNLNLNDINIEYLITCALVFVAVIAVVMTVVRTLVEATKASEERLNLEQMGALSGAGELSPMSRFISKARLFRFRIVFMIAFGLLPPAILLSAGVRSPWAISILGGVFAFIGWRLPLSYFTFLVKRRQTQFESEILDFALGLNNALKAGMALPQAIEKISTRMHGVMKEELQTVQREYRLGVDLVTALEHLHKRMPCEDIRLLVSAIRITSEAGGSLAEVIKEMTEMIRGRREFQDKVKTLTAEGRFEALAMALAPVAAFFFMYFIQPELMRTLYTTTMGWCALGAVAVLEIMGYWVINKIVTIEV